MTNIELEARMTQLEREVAALKMQIAQNLSASPAWWEKIAGTFKDDEAHEEAMRLGREYRLPQNTAVNDEK